MRIEAISAENFMSFDVFDLSGFNPSLNVIVGPNGVGKTNLARALLLIRDVLDIGSNRNRQTWLQAYRQGSNTKRFQVSIEYALTDPWEKRVIQSFIKATLASAPDDILLISGLQPVPEERQETFQAWIENEITVEKLESLFSGEIVVERLQESTGQWEVSLLFEHQKDKYEWILEGSRKQPGLFKGDASARRVETQKPYAFISRYLGEDDATSFSEPFDLEHMLPEEGLGLSQFEVNYDGGGLRPKAVLDFVELMGMDTGDTGRRFNLMQVLARIWNMGLNMTENIRGEPQLEYTLEDLTKPLTSRDLSDGVEIPLYLFRLKNGDVLQRQTFRKIESTYLKLTGNNIEVTISNIPTEIGEAGTSGIRIEPVISTDTGDIPIELSGAGAWESLVVSIFLCHPQDTVLLLDEPALNLHPSAQRKLCPLLRNKQGQSFVITHSPYLLPIESEQDLHAIIRLYREKNSTHWARLLNNEQSTLTQQEASGLLKELRASADFGAMLFSNGVIMTEGETELGALALWFAESEIAKEHGSPVDLNLALLDVGGQNNFRKYVGFAKAYNIPWAIVCDGPALREGWILEELGTNRELPVKDKDFQEVKQRAEESGVYTLADGYDDEFEDFPTVQQHMEEAKRRYGRSKVRAGRYIAQQTRCPSDVEALYQKLLYRFRLIQEGGAIVA